MRVIILTLVLAAALNVRASNTALVVAPAHDRAWEPVADVLLDAAAEAGYEAKPATFDAINAAGGIDAAEVPLLILPDASAIPAQALPHLTDYLRGGGDLFACNTPLGRTLLLANDDEWITREAYAEVYADDLMETPLFDFSGDSPLADWRRNTNDPSISVTHEVVDSEVGPALHVTMEKLENWETYVAPSREDFFPESHTLTVFWAKGSVNTTALAIEWGERDGSRWIATVPLGDEWRQYVLQPSDFQFWESVPARKGTTFNPAEASHVSFGLARSHTRVRGEEQAYWLGTVGTAAWTPLHESLLMQPDLPTLETLSPAYKFYPVSDVARAFVPERHAFLDTGDFPLPAYFQCMHPRPSAAGFDKGRDGRWLSLLEAESNEGDWRGVFATLYVNAGGDYEGSVWASFAVSDPAWYTQDSTRGVLAAAFARMREGLFLIDGGADHYTYFAQQERLLGARIANFGPEPRTVDVALSLLAETQSFEAILGCTIDPGEVARLEELDTGVPPEGTAYAAILDGERALDQVHHEVHAHTPDPEPKFITIEDGDFMLDGARWRPHGVNYMPSSGIGVEDQPYFEFWIGARSYDPVIVERDLRRVKAMGMNAISVFIYRESMEAGNLLDLLRICDELGLYVNLSLRPGTPLDFRWDEMRALIEYYRLWEHDTIFALDLAWEPMFGDHEERKRWDAAWRAWVVERYGSIENAVDDWAFEPPRDANGELTNPTGEMVTSDGEWRVYVAAYRRFLDTLLYEHYRAAYEKVRALDPRHAISFRMTEAGNPTFNWAKRIPYDYPYLAAAVDILEPEAYGRIGDWEVVKPGWFQYEYGRWSAPQLPFMWAEAGVHVWSRAAMTQTQELLDFQAEYYEHLYRMFISSGADGIFFWWYPGGYRVNEQSDYGIINPDGTDRPVTKVIREHADDLINGPDAPEITTWLTIDRDKHPTGVNGIYETHKEAFWSAIEAGEAPGLRTEATGTDSTNCPLIAVGNVPYDGWNPPKYLDGFFDKVEVQHALGHWVDAVRDERIPVKRGEPVRLRVTVANLGEATWRAPGAQVGEGGVSILVNRSGQPSFVAAIIHDVARHQRAIDFQFELPGSDATSSVISLSLQAAGRAVFGPEYRLRLVTGELELDEAGILRLQHWPYEGEGGS